MTTGYGISGIGYPMGLGTYGLNTGGAYGSYDNYMPSMMGMNPAMSMNGSIYGANPMMAMYNPLYMTQTQQQIEASQLAHAGNMHTGVLGNEVRANRTTDSALIQKVLTNGDVHQGVQNLYTKVKAGDQEGICEEFAKLKNYIYTTYSDELAARSDKINPAVSTTKIIEVVYGNIISAQTGQISDLRSDIVRYGESSFKNGFMQGFRRGHQQRYVDETLNYCFGLSINQKGSKDFRQGVGEISGRVTSVGEKALWGAAVGSMAYTLGGGVTSLTRKTFGASLLDFKFKTLGKFAVAGAILAAIGDIAWQFATPSENAA